MITGISARNDKWKETATNSLSMHTSPNLFLSRLIQIFILEKTKQGNYLFVLRLSLYSDDMHNSCERLERQRSCYNYCSRFILFPGSIIMIKPHIL